MPAVSRTVLSAFLAGMILLGVAPCASAAEPPADVEFTKDIVYGHAGAAELKLDMSRPKDAKGPLPCVVFIHGGGWAGGSKADHDPQTWDFARKGYVTVTVEYRLTNFAKWPAQINDVKCAVRFLRENAQKYGIDPEKFGAVGFSAGAHLAMMLAVTDKADGLEGAGGSADQSSRINCAVSFFGPTDLARDDIPPLVHNLVKDLVGHVPASGDPACKAASPVTYASEGDAPMLLFQGTTDVLVPYNQAMLMADAMARASIPGRVEVIMNVGHGWGGAELTRTAESTAAFLAEHLKAPPKK